MAVAARVPRLKKTVVAASLSCIVMLLPINLLFFSQAEAQSPLNFVIILTDDQRPNTIAYMPNVKQLLKNEGVIFSNAVATTPLCCPARASFLSGGLYPYETNVKHNSAPNGGAPIFTDTRDTLAINLQKAGYETALIGKYVNRYLTEQNRVPPGWNHWQAFVPDIAFYNFSVSEGSSTSTADGVTTVSQVTNKLSTTWVNEEALQFIDQNHGSPFFLYLAYMAPHEPAKAAPQDEHRHDGFVFSSPGTLETDFSDKPSWLQEWREEMEAREAANPTDPVIYTIPEYQLESLREVDRGVKRIVDKLAAEGILDKTVIVYTSDNGYMWGEHGGLIGKNLPYQESLKVPLIVRMPGGLEKVVKTEVVAWNLDVAATIYDLAGIEDAPTSGLSLAPLLTGAIAAWRAEIVVQGYGNQHVEVPIPPNPFFVGMYTKSWKYVEYPTGERELYNLYNDPYELENQASNPDYARMMKGFSNRLRAQTGLTVVTEKILPNATLGEPYSVQLKTWGGKAPITWSIYPGSALPADLTLSSDGVISGTPMSTHRYGVNFRVVATDTPVLPVYGKPQRFTGIFKIYLD